MKKTTSTDRNPLAFRAGIALKGMRRLSSGLTSFCENIVLPITPANKRFQLLEIIEHYWYKYTVIKEEKLMTEDGKAFGKRQARFKGS